MPGGTAADIARDAAGPAGRITADGAPSRGKSDGSALGAAGRGESAAAPAWTATVRPPRLGGSSAGGVFATRSPFRPNPIGLTCVKLERVELTDVGPVIHVLAVDLRDGTPIYDIKPYIPFADCHPEATGGSISPRSLARARGGLPLRAAGARPLPTARA